MNRETVMKGTFTALSQMTEADQTKFCVWLQSDELRSLIDDPRVPGIEDQMNWFKRVQQPENRTTRIRLHRVVNAMWHVREDG